MIDIVLFSGTSLVQFKVAFSEPFLFFLSSYSDATEILVVNNCSWSFAFLNYIGGGICFLLKLKDMSSGSKSFFLLSTCYGSFLFKFKSSPDETILMETYFSSSLMIFALDLFKLSESWLRREVLLFWGLGTYLLKKNFDFYWSFEYFLDLFPALLYGVKLSSKLWLKEFSDFFIFKFF